MPIHRPPRDSLLPHSSVRGEVRRDSATYIGTAIIVIYTLIILGGLITLLPGWKSSNTND